MTTLRTDSTHSGITIEYADGSGFVHGGSGPLTVYSDEFKSVKDVPPANFLEQFGKDLKNTEVSDLSQIKWIFDGKKVTQQQLTDAIKETIDKWKVPEDVLNKWGYSKYQSDVFKTEVLYKDEIYKEIFKSY